MVLWRSLKHCIKKYEPRFCFGVRIFNIWRSVSNVNQITYHIFSNNFNSISSNLFIIKLIFKDALFLFPSSFNDSVYSVVIILNSMYWFFRNSNSLLISNLLTHFITFSKRNISSGPSPGNDCSSFSGGFGSGCMAEKNSTA